MKPVAELVLEQMAVGDASSLRVHWLTNELPPVGTKLYTHPNKHDLGIAEAIGFDKGYKASHPVKELTDEEIISTMVQFDVYSSDDHCLIDAGKAILRKAQEK